MITTALLTVTVPSVAPPIVLKVVAGISSEELSLIVTLPVKLIVPDKAISKSAALPVRVVLVV